MKARTSKEKRDTPGADEPSFDVVVEQLRQVVATLERGEQSLEESLSLYEKGVALTRRGHDLLNTAEKRIELLVGPGGATAPLYSDDADEFDDNDHDDDE